mgnify:CR=1 FL=1
MNDNVITIPQLLPRNGYVEIIDDNGNHVYQATQETEEKLKLQDDLIQTQLQLQQSDDTAIELYEKTAILEEANSQQDDSIIAIFEKIGG